MNSTEVYYYVLLILLSGFIGFQVCIPELKLLSAKYHYRIQFPQFVTFISALLILLIAARDFFLWASYWELLIAFTIGSCIICMFGEWVLTLLNPHHAIISWGFRFLLFTSLGIFILFREDISPLTPFAISGMLLRNSVFGIPHGKNLSIACHLSRKLVFPNPDTFDSKKVQTNYIPDTKYAGNLLNNPIRTKYDVTKYDILPNTGQDLTSNLQVLIDEIGKKGGGSLFFPKGKYKFNEKGDHFIQINYSNITLEGELDQDGNPLAELVNCGKTSRGIKNPWVSPFFITTGERIQPSNEFWGLQFRKRKSSFNRSNSLSDPGSDGNILSPIFATHIIASSKEGDDILHVENSEKLGKYILVGLYNTSPDGNLIKDILGMQELRPEWSLVHRAGEEEAPSYQLLTEIKEVIDKHTVQIVRPLLRDCNIEYEPAIYNVEMLEGICIRNLKLSSTWNGQFRHHGFPLYYNIGRTQEMDYGWNAINMKRVAYGTVQNVIIQNFTNPIYVMDSRNVTVKDIVIKGYDGHQGLKVYMHACDNLFENIVFKSHFADMMGGEGNAYANVFRRISYMNPVFKPVDYDFHGFAEGPMSPPANNMFTQIRGFRYIKSAGALTHLPSCAQNNTWWNLETEGEGLNDYLFFAMTYRQKEGILKFVTAIGYAVARIQKTHNFSPCNFIQEINQKLASIDEIGIERKKHILLFPKSRVFAIKTWSNY